MSRAIPLLPLYAFMVWTRRTLLYYPVGTAAWAWSWPLTSNCMELNLYSPVGHVTMLYKDHGHHYLWPCAFYESAWGRGGKALVILNLNRGKMPASRPRNVVPNAQNAGWSPRASLDILKEVKNLLSLLGIKPWFLVRPAHSLVAKLSPS